MRSQHPKSSSTGQPRVSVVTPVLNGVKYIRRTLESVRDQSYPNVEHIVVDGGSIDGTIDVLREFEAPDFHWTSGPDSSQAQAINKGMSNASGRILVWLNSDDLFVPSTIDRVVCTFGAQPEAQFCYGHVDLINSSDGHIRRLLTCKQTLASYRTDGGNIFQGTVFFTRRAWEEHGPLDESMKCAFEYRLFDALFAHCQGVFVNAVLAKYRLHSESISSRYPELFAKELARVRGAPPSRTKRELFRARRLILTTLDGNLLVKLRGR